MARPGWHGGVAMRTAAESAGFDRARHAWIAVALAASTLFAASSAPAPAQVYQVPPGANPQATEPAPAPTPAAGADDDADQSLAPASGPVMTPDEARIEVDVSTRSVAVTSAFTGTEIVVFGAVAGRKAGELEERPVDIVVIVEGTFEPLVVRRKLLAKHPRSELQTVEIESGVMPAAHFVFKDGTHYILVCARIQLGKLKNMRELLVA